MNEQQYLEQRVEPQIEWYDKKSSRNHKWFQYLKIVETILALLIPFLSGYIKVDGNGLKITIGIIGIVVAAITNLITICKFQENWIQYRTVAESLKHEKFLYITKAGPYKGDDSFAAFAERIESNISSENAQWASYIKQKNDK